MEWRSNECVSTASSKDCEREELESVVTVTHESTNCDSEDGSSAATSVNSDNALDNICMREQDLILTRRGRGEFGITSLRLYSDTIGVVICQGDWELGIEGLLALFVRGVTKTSINPVHLPTKSFLF